MYFQCSYADLGALLTILTRMTPIIKKTDKGEVEENDPEMGQVSVKWDAGIVTFQSDNP